MSSLRAAAVVLALLPAAAAADALSGHVVTTRLALRLLRRRFTPTPAQATRLETDLRDAIALLGVLLEESLTRATTPARAVVEHVGAARDSRMEMT